MTDLLPCPFCGSKGVVTRSHNADYRVECWERNERCPLDIKTHYEISYPKAVKAWNTRTASTTTEPKPCSLCPDHNYISKEHCKECVVDGYKDEIKQLTAVIERLASCEAMTLSFSINKRTNEGRELEARLEYACKALHQGVRA